VPAVGWALLGLVTGAVLTLAGVRLTGMRRRTRDRATAEPALDPEWVLTDQLASAAPPRR
jgi:hypothetical protein